ncbi:hypothetical protein AVEN_135724-1 [Araneus ventricosus]|uniref:Uncharacterized protein n=1 Tax=Araneus ventricosus TaxID=182803 RepID=A0A4Y2FKS6_ARAVE|nr:hypothetical protein AVEN_135724-1 [Araneus ventricosus]
MIAFIQINRVLASSPREPRRNLSAATKHVDLTDKTPSTCKSNILYLLLLPAILTYFSPSSSHPKSLRSPWNEESNPNGKSGSVRGVRVLNEERIRSFWSNLSPVVPFEDPDLRNRSGVNDLH